MTDGILSPCASRLLCLLFQWQKLLVSPTARSNNSSNDTISFFFLLCCPYYFCTNACPTYLFTLPSGLWPPDCQGWPSFTFLFWVCSSGLQVYDSSRYCRRMEKMNRLAFSHFLSFFAIILTREPFCNHECQLSQLQYFIPARPQMWMKVRGISPSMRVSEGLSVETFIKKKKNHYALIKTATLPHLLSSGLFQKLLANSVLWQLRSYSAASLLIRFLEQLKRYQLVVRRP